MPVSGSIFTVFGELILISICSLTFGSVRSLDGRNLERTWSSTVNMRNTGYKGREWYFCVGLMMFKSSTGPSISFLQFCTRHTKHIRIQAEQIIA